MADQTTRVELAQFEVGQPAGVADGAGLRREPPLAGHGATAIQTELEGVRDQLAVAHPDLHKQVRHRHLVDGQRGRRKLGRQVGQHSVADRHPAGQRGPPAQRHREVWFQQPGESQPDRTLPFGGQLQGRLGLEPQGAPPFQQRRVDRDFPELQLVRRHRAPHGERVQRQAPPVLTEQGVGHVEPDLVARLPAVLVDPQVESTDGAVQRDRQVAAADPASPQDDRLELQVEFTARFPFPDRQVVGRQVEHQIQADHLDGHRREPSLEHIAGVQRQAQLRDAAEERTGRGDDRQVPGLDGAAKQVVIPIPHHQLQAGLLGQAGIDGVEQHGFEQGRVEEPPGGGRHQGGIDQQAHGPGHFEFLAR